MVSISLKQIYFSIIISVAKYVYFIYFLKDVYSRLIRVFFQIINLFQTFAVHYKSADHSEYIQIQDYCSAKKHKFKKTSLFDILGRRNYNFSIWGWVTIGSPK